MLTLTDNASLAIEGILSSETIPDGAGVRIAPPPGEDAASSNQFQVTIAGSPADTDQVIDSEGARVFLDESVVGLLDDKLLDASIIEDQIHFVLGTEGPAGAPGSGSNGASGDV